MKVNQRWIAGITMIVLLNFSLWSWYQTNPQGRFIIFRAPRSSKSPTTAPDRVFKMDTHTGRVWYLDMAIASTNLIYAEDGSPLGPITYEGWTRIDDFKESAMEDAWEIARRIATTKSNP